jgi:lipoprotein-anchoring transpeptidase ErfK/SrfK
MNPLGPYALYLSWNSTASTDPRHAQDRPPLSNGCIGLYNEHIIELFGLADIGHAVK